MTEINKIPTKKLWNPKSFIIFSVLFSFLPAGIMCSLNYGRCGNQRRKWTCLLSTILGFIALITLAIILSIKTPIIFLPINIGVAIYFRNIQRKLYEEHIQNGGERASYFLPIIIGVLIFVFSAASFIYSAYIPEKSLDYGKNHVYYTDNITKSQAENLGDYLKSEIFFSSDSEIDIKIDKQKDIYVFSMIVDDNYLTDEEFINAMKASSKLLSLKVFENNKVRIDLCNDRFKVLKSIISAD